MRLSRPRTSLLVLILACILVSPSLIAQQYFQGPYQLGVYRGNGQFQFKLNDTDTVFSGPFRFHQASIESLLSKEGDKHFQITGAFSKGLAQGEWSFQFGDFRANKSTEVKNNQYVIGIRGLQHTAKGKLVAGKASGRWLHRVESLDSSSESQLDFESDIEYDGGVPQKSFRIRNKQFTLLGRFLRDGLAHDEWDLYADELRGLRERWVFADGRLVEMVLANEFSYDTVKVFEEPLADELTVHLDERYIRLLDVIQRINGNTSIDSRMNRLLEENNQYYEKIDEILTALNSTSFMPDFKVKVQYLPLTRDEQRELRRLENLILQVEKLSSSVSSNTQLQMLKITEKDVSFQVALIKALSEDFLAPARELLALEGDSIIQYLSRDTLLLSLAGTMEDLYTIKVTFDDGGTRKSVPYALAKSVDLNSHPVGVSGFVTHAEQVFHAVDSINGILEDNLLKQVRMQELEVLERELVDLADSLMSVSDSLSRQTNPSGLAAESIRAEMTESLRSYSKIENLVAKIDTVNLLIACSKTSISIIEQLKELPDKSAEIKELYTDRIWNPFTATLMDEEVKKRITAAYNRVLLPYYLEQVSLDASCENVETILSLLEMTHGRMVELRQEDTSKLERRLKRQTEPLEILQLLGIQSTESN